MYEIIRYKYLYIKPHLYFKNFVTASERFLIDSSSYIETACIFLLNSDKSFLTVLVDGELVNLWKTTGRNC